MKNLRMIYQLSLTWDYFHLLTLLFLLFMDDLPALSGSSAAPPSIMSGLRTSLIALWSLLRIHSMNSCENSNGKLIYFRHGEFFFQNRKTVFWTINRLKKHYERITHSGYISPKFWSPWQRLVCPVSGVGAHRSLTIETANISSNFYPFISWSAWMHKFKVLGGRNSD